MCRNSAKLPRNGSDDAALEEVGRAEQALGRGERQDVGLLEVGVRGVDDQRDPLGDVVPELHRQGVVARLGVGQRGGRELGLGGIVVQVDVRAPQDPPVELAVLDLVLAEAEELARTRSDGASAPRAPATRRGADHPAQDWHIRLTSTWIVRIRSPWVIRARVACPAVTRPKIV